MLSWTDQNKEVVRFSKDSAIAYIRSNTQYLGFFQSTFFSSSVFETMDIVQDVIGDGRAVRAIVWTSGLHTNKVLFYVPKKFKRIRVKNNQLRVFFDDQLRIITFDSSERAKNIRKLLM